MIPAMSMAEREQAVLVVIDIQARLAAAMAHRERVVACTAFLVRAAEIAGLPIVVTRQYPQGLGDLEDHIAAVIAEAQGARACVSRVDKTTFDCFGEPTFCDEVAVTARKQLILTGMETHICVTQTALAGLAQGFDVHVAADACCSRDDENARIALDRLTGAGAVVTSAESVAYELIGRAGTEEFKRLLAAVKQLG